MSASAMSHNERSDTDTHRGKPLCRPRLSSFLHGERMPVLFLRTRSNTARLITMPLNWEAGDISHAASIYAIREAAPHTPPPR